MEDRRGRWVPRFGCALGCTAQHWLSPTFSGGGRGRRLAGGPFLGALELLEAEDREFPMNHPRHRMQREPHPSVNRRQGCAPRGKQYLGLRPVPRDAEAITCRVGVGDFEFE
jgi:hypothetical protein